MTFVRICSFLMDFNNLQEITIVLNDIGPEDVIQIVTDNGSNFKKACKLLAEEYPHIVWQPCLAHTINLILKDIGKWDDHKAMIQSAQYICQWLYNSNSVHSMFKSATGGELVKWNATRFGTNYMFLESFMKKKDQFMVWMMSTEYRSSRHYKTEAGKYAFECMTSVQWWANMQYVINDVEPLYSFLRFADQDKTPTLGEVLMEYGSLKRTYHTRFHSDMARCDRIMEIVDRRLASVFEGTYAHTACAVHPYACYAFGISENVFGDLRKGLERLFDIDRAIRALQEYELFRQKLGEFSSDLAARMAKDRGTSPASWWAMFGSETPHLQIAAKRLLSQCASSSGCERNWSSFAFIHTKLRNRLSSMKLHNLVYVHYNLRLRIQRATATVEASEFDPATSFMDLSLYRQTRPIEEWMQHGRSNRAPTLDEDSDFADPPVPAQILTDLARRVGEPVNVDDWARENIGDTHLGKRKTKIPPNQSKRKKQRKGDVEEESIGTDDTTPEPSDDGHGGSGGDDDDDDDDDDDGDGNEGGDDNDDDDGDDRGGASTSGAPTGAMRFMGETAFTHATQDRDHGAPSSQRRTRSNTRPLGPYDGEDDGSSTSVSSTYSYPSAPSFVWPPQPHPMAVPPRPLYGYPHMYYQGYLPYGNPHMYYQEYPPEQDPSE